MSSVLRLALQAPPGCRCPATSSVRHVSRCWRQCLGRLRRQEAPHCTSVSFERHAANAFQSYVSGALAFSIKRGGVLYGNVDEEGRAVVEVIYEPEQVLPLQARRSSDDDWENQFTIAILAL